MWTSAWAPPRTLPWALGCQGGPPPSLLPRRSLFASTWTSSLPRPDHTSAPRSLLAHCTRMFSCLLDVSLWRPQVIQTKYGCLFLPGYFPSWKFSNVFRELWKGYYLLSNFSTNLTLFRDEKNWSLERLSNLPRVTEFQHLNPSDSKVSKLGVDSF